MPRGIDPGPITSAVNATVPASKRGIDPGPVISSVNDLVPASKRGIGTSPSEPGGTK
jgi:hypothetical protein